MDNLNEQNSLLPESGYFWNHDFSGTSDFIQLEDNQSYSPLSRKSHDVSIKISNRETDFISEIQKNSDAFETCQIVKDPNKSASCQCLRRLSIWKFVTNIWKRPLFCHLRTCVGFLIFKVFLSMADVGSDICTGIEHFQNGDSIWGSLTIGVIFLPSIATFLVSLILSICHFIEKCLGRNYEKPLFYTGWQNLPFVPGFRNARIFIGMATMDTTNPLNMGLVSKLKLKATEVSSIEAVLESAPQLMLQIHILLTTGKISHHQIRGIIISFFSLWFTSLTMFFSARVQEEKESEPNWRFKLIVAPFVFMDLLGSVLLASLLFVFPKVILSIMGIPIIIACRFLTSLKNPIKELKGELSDFNMRKNELQLHRTLILASFASWMVNTVVVKSTKNCQFGPLAILYFGLTLFGIYKTQSEKTSVEDYSVVICSPQNLTSELPSWTETQMFYNFIPVMVFSIDNSTKHFVRICDEDEQPNDVLSIITVLMCVTLFLQLASDTALSILSDYHQLVKFMKIFGLSYFHYIDVIENPGGYQNHESFFWLLHSNINSLNRQHPLNGKTIMHVADKIMSTDGIIKLVKKGARVDIQDYAGQTAQEVWIESYRTEFDEFLSSLTGEKNKLNVMQKLIESNHVIWFSLCAILGFKLEARNDSGTTILESLTMKIAKRDSEKDSLQFLKYLSFKDILKVIILVIKYQKVEDRYSIIQSIYQNQKEIIQKNYWVNKIKSLGLKSHCVKFFLLENDDEIHEIVQEMSQMQIKDDFKQIEQLLNYSCKEGKSKLAKHLLECDFSLHFQDFIEKRTPLHEASLSGHSSCVKVLLAHKSDLNKRSKHGYTPMHVASQNGHSDCIKLLIESGATDVNAKTNDMETSLHLACEQGLSGYAKLFPESSADSSKGNDGEEATMHVKHLRRYVDCLETLLKAQADASLKNKNGETALHIASFGGSADFVQLLLKENADPNVKNNCLETPLHLSCKAGHSGCVKVLLGSGADPNLKNSDDETPLHVACSGGHPECVELLLKSNADWNVINKDGDTPLMIASSKGHSNCVKLLLYSKLKVESLVLNEDR